MTETNKFDDATTNDDEVDSNSQVVDVDATADIDHQSQPSTDRLQDTTTPTAITDANSTAVPTVTSAATAIATATPTTTTSTTAAAAAATAEVVATTTDIDDETRQSKLATSVPPLTSSLPATEGTPVVTSIPPTQPPPKTKHELVNETVVLQPFGKGIVLEYRDNDQMYVIKLTSEVSYSGAGILYTQQHPTIVDNNNDQLEDSSPNSEAAELNVALEKLETMRRMNLQVECHELGIFDVDYNMCTCCLKERGGSSSSTTDHSHFPRLQKFMDSTSEQMEQMDIQNFPRLNSFFNSSALSSSTTTMTTNAATSSLADQTSASLCAPGTSSSSPPEVERGSATVATTTTTPETIEPPQSRTVQPQPTAPPPAAAAPSFPRLNKLWGTIQNLPQPVTKPSPPLPPNTSTSSDDNATAEQTAGIPTKNAEQSTDSNNQGSTTTSPTSTTTSFPRIRGLINKSKVASSSSMLSSMSLPAGASNILGVGSSTSTAASATEATSPTRSTTSNNSPTNNNVGNSKPKALPRIQKLLDQRERANTSPCLVCGSPTCPKHSSTSFRREGITLCLSCERFFELDFIVDCVNDNPAERSKNIDHMIDCYDRCVLMLRYSAQFVEPIAKALEEQNDQQNKIGLASSGVGVLSGVLGIAAAASILTPAGPPLLIASLFFGGGATTVQTGSEAMNYFSEPRKVADRVIALHGMAMSLLRVTSTLRDAMLRDHVRTDVYEAESVPLSEFIDDKVQKNRVAVLAGSNVGRSLTLGGVAGARAATGTATAGAASAAGAAAVAGAEGTAVAGAATAGAGAARGATAFSRAGTAAARSIRFARFAGGALSAAVLVMEANAIRSTLDSINEGTCEKADTLRRVAQEVDGFPTTSALDEECRAYIEAMESRPPRPPVATEVVAITASSNNMESTLDIPRATCQPAVADLSTSQQLSAPGTLIVEGDRDVVQDMSSSYMIPSAQAVPAEPESNPLSSSSTLFSSVSLSFSGVGLGGQYSNGGGSSFFQRLQSRQEQRQDGRDEVMAAVVENNRGTRGQNAEVNLLL